MEQIATKLMGCQFKLSVCHTKENTAANLLKIGIEEIKRIEALLSEFLPDSETNRLNKLADQQQVKVSRECFDLIKRSLSISQLTDGCFDITVSPLKRLYQFKNRNFIMPDKSIIHKTRDRVGYQKIKLNESNCSIQFLQKNMHISFAAIGKGYASDCVKKLWLKKGVTSGYINASGDLNTIGRRADGLPWRVAISSPDTPDKTIFHIPVTNASVATSGDYEQYFTYKSERYSHNIHPKTGFPLTGIKSVSVFSPSAELSDALATAVYVKGVKQGINFINNLPQTHAIIIDDGNECSFSKNIKYEVYP